MRRSILNPNSINSAALVEGEIDEVFLLAINSFSGALPKQRLIWIHRIDTPINAFIINKNRSVILE